MISLYPTGIVYGPCVCGSWPGGPCFRCPLVEPTKELVTRSVTRYKNLKPEKFLTGESNAGTQALARKFDR